MQDIEEVYKENFNIVYKYLFCLTHNGDIAEELTQETFYRAVKNIRSFQGKCKMTVWLCQIAKNLWYDELSRKKKNKELNIEDIEIESLENMEEIVFSNNERKNMYKKIQKLDKTTKEVIILRIKGDLSFKEIGNILNKTENWARVTFYRGKQKLKEVDEDEKQERM